MSEEWDFYMCRVNDELASIYLDLQVATDQVVQHNPYRAHVRVVMRNPRPDGLSSQEEFTTLGRIEDQLILHLGKSKQARYVGRVTSAGYRDFYFYAAAETALQQSTQAAMQHFPDYRYELAIEADPQWSTYTAVLSPSPVELQRMGNRRVCQALEEAGDAFTTPRPIEHWVYFDNADARARFIEQAGSLGYRLVDRHEQGPQPRRFGVCVSSIGIPSPQHIDELTLPVFHAAQACGGEYDGWETQVLKAQVSRLQAFIERSKRLIGL